MGADRGTHTQIVRGKITDSASGEVIPYATVAVIDLPQVGATSDSTGHFTLRHVPIGRYSLQVSFVGYETTMIKEVMVTTGKELFLDIALNERVSRLNEVVVRPKVNKERPLNNMAMVGARMFSIEETTRYAGSFGDPARLAASFAGVSSDGSSNGISIHGNAPHLLSWHIEGIEVPNPNHFADISVAGGGMLSSLSTQVVGNSDFLTSAFPAEYGNAISGIFDVRMRPGNNLKHEHTVQVGTLGIDMASEGPIGRGGGASYIVNYRYSAIGLAQKLNFIDMGDQSVDYQDLNLKINLSTRCAGTFALWGTALADNTDNNETDTAKWETIGDKYHSKSEQYMVAGGVNHSLYMGHGRSLKTTVATSYFNENNDANSYSYGTHLKESPFITMRRRFTNLIFNTAYNHKLNASFTCKSGLDYRQAFYKMDMQKAPYMEQEMRPVYHGNGNTGLLSAYSGCLVNINNYVLLNMGIHLQWLQLNGKMTFEPRTAICWQPTARTTFAAAYGLHSRMETPDVYFVKIDGKEVNKNLGFTKAHHFMLSYSYRINDNIILKAEPFFQLLFNVPVEAGGSYSLLNRIDFYMDKALVNRGRGENYGIDATIEHYLSNGFYSMLTGTVFNSRYCGGDGVWHNSRYNRRFIINALGGKEWVMGQKRQNTLSVNLKLVLQGGDCYSPVDEDATLLHPDKDVQYDENNAFSKRLHPMFFYNYSISYKMNKRRVMHRFALDFINSKGYQGHVYNFKKKVIETSYSTFALPNMSYRLEF